MAFKAMLFLLASFLLVTTRVSSNGEEFLNEDYTIQKGGPPKVPTQQMILARPPPFVPPHEMIPAKVPVPAPAPVKAPPPAHVPIKAPAPAPPVKPPVSAPPVKPPVSSPSVKPPVSAPPVKPPVSAPMPPPIKTKKDCIPPCTERCKLHSRKGLCLRACMTCCDRCKCVPPGTYGNREKCGKCYTDMTTRGGKLKCP